MKAKIERFFYSVQQISTTQYYNDTYNYIGFLWKSHPNETKEKKILCFSRRTESGVFTVELRRLRARFTLFLCNFSFSSRFYVWLCVRLYLVVIVCDCICVCVTLFCQHRHVFCCFSSSLLLHLIKMHAGSCLFSKKNKVRLTCSPFKGFFKLNNGCRLSTWKCLIYTKKEPPVCLLPSVVI